MQKKKKKIQYYLWRKTNYSKFSKDIKLYINTKQGSVDRRSRLSSGVERVTFNHVAVGSIPTDGVMFLIFLNFLTHMIL